MWHSFGGVDSVRGAQQISADGDRLPNEVTLDVAQMELRTSTPYS